VKLNDIYGNFVAPKGSITPLQHSNPSSLPIKKERDPKSVQLEADVALKMNKALQQQQPVEAPKPVQPPQQVKDVSFEEALKELAELEKKNKQS